MPERRRPGPSALSWQEAAPAPVVLVAGPEELLAERAVQRVLAAVRADDPDVEVSTLEAELAVAGTLATATSPSLFAQTTVAVVVGLERATDDLIADLVTYLSAPASDVVLVLRHSGGNRGKKVLDTVRAAGFPVVACDAVRSDADKCAFVSAELRAADRRVAAAAVRALVDAVGSDLRELASACAQLVADTTGTVTADVVDRYYGGRVEATGFQVADAAVGGDAGRAVALLRHALDTGTDPLPLVAALAMKLRTMAKVAAVRGRGTAGARDLGLAPWQVDRAAAELRHWTPEALAVAIGAVAEADAQVKGASRDRRHAVERAVLQVARAASR